MLTPKIPNILTSVTLTARTLFVESYIELYVIFLAINLMFDAIPSSIGIYANVGVGYALWQVTLLYS